MTSVAVVGGGFGGVGAAVMLRRAGLRGRRRVRARRARRRRVAPQHLPRRRLRHPIAPVRVLVRAEPPVVAALRAAGRDPGLRRGRGPRARRAGPDPDRHRGHARALGRGARQVDARDDRGPPRGRRPPDRLRPAVGPQRPSDPRARDVRGPGLPHGAVAPRRRPRRPARRGDRHRVQRHPGRARHPADRRAHRRLPALPGLDVPEDGRPLQRAGPAPVRALPGASSASTAAPSWRSRSSARSR